MTTTLTFTLPDDDHEHKCAISGASAISVLREFDQLLRQHIKYDAIPEHIKTPSDYAEHIREVLNDMTIEAGLTEVLNS